MPNLSAIASLLYREALNNAECWDHIDDFGAGHECGGLVAKGMKKRAVEIFDDLGFTPKEVRNAIEDRTSSRWLYQTGISEMIDMADEVFEERERDHSARLFRIQMPATKFMFGPFQDGRY